MRRAPHVSIRSTRVVTGVSGLGRHHRSRRGGSATFPADCRVSFQYAMKRIVIIGGGFGGVYTARFLEQRLDPSEAEIALVNRENYFVFQPLLPEVISGNIGLLDTVSPIRRLCPRTRLYTRE